MRNFWIWKRLSWFWKSCNIADRGGGLFLGIHARTDIRIDISISIGPISIEFGKQVHLQELSQMGYQADAGDAITSRSCDKLKTLYLQYHSGYAHQN